MNLKELIDSTLIVEDTPNAYALGLLRDVFPTDDGIESTSGINFNHARFERASKLNDSKIAGADNSDDFANKVLSFAKAKRPNLFKGAQVQNFIGTLTNISKNYYNMFK